VFVNEMGMEEIGIDAGGLFKELWTSLAGVAFNPEYGFFKTTSQGQLYPNPNAAIAMDGLNEDSLSFWARFWAKHSRRAW
jgi:ubiquitin-protein ligase E3 C